MRIAFLGDIALIGKYDITKNPYVKEKLKVMSENLKDFDYVVANLETPLTEIKKSWICKSMHLRSCTENVELLKFLHINAVSLANNHIYDFGKNGFEETIKILDDSGIEWFGANSKHLLKVINGEKVCFSGFCCYSTNGTGYLKNNDKTGINTLTYDNIMRQLNVDKDNEAFSILSFHWGTEHTNYPSYEHTRLAELISKNKDVLIYGHHPHVIQGIQKINNSVIAYSLGNCLFDDCTSIKGNFRLKQNINNKTSFILEVDIGESQINTCKCHGFKDEENGLIFFDINPEIQQISEELNRIEDIKIYEAKRENQFNKAILNKFGKHDFKWLISRLNYYSIGARITAIFRNRRYLRESKKFLGGTKNG
ncbi:MAG: CapA family protein [Bacilli bacterium]|nr:CapA family protein [Bacilli bacterium]